MTLALSSFYAVAADPAPPENAAPSPSASTSAEENLELYACCYGRSKYPESGAFVDGRKDVNIDFAWGFYVARSGTQVTLIDAGMSDPDVAKQWHVSVTRDPAQLLADLNIDPASVNRVIITHIHFDHVSNLPLFPQAQVFISRRDRDDYVNKKALDGVVYDPRIADVLNDPARTHVIDQRETLPGGFDVEVVGGHTAGSAVVHLFRQGTHYVLVGDECYLQANQKEQRPIGRTANRARNVEFLARIADPAIVVLPCHDPAIFTGFPAVTPNIVRIFGPQP